MKLLYKYNENKFKNGCFKKYEIKNAIHSIIFVII